jgi:hypothetical protein
VTRDIIIEGLIGGVKSRDPEYIQRLWEYFDKYIHDPVSNKRPYPELGVRLSRGKVIKKYHNCAAIVDPKAPFGTWTYAFLGRDKELAVEDVVLIHFANFKVINISLANMKARKILFSSWLDKVYGKIVIGKP